jgi:hypothetical protein
MALSLRQPWASLIIYGFKTVEIRGWTTDYRGTLFIHASKTLDENAMLRFKFDDMITGCLIGTVELIGVEPLTPHMWMESATQHLGLGPYSPGLYAWRLSDPKPLPEPVPYRGERRLFFITDSGPTQESNQRTLFS